MKHLPLLGLLLSAIAPPVGLMISTKALRVSTHSEDRLISRAGLFVGLVGTLALSIAIGTYFFAI